MKYIKLFENWYDSENFRGHYDMPPDEDLVDWEIERAQAAYDGFRHDVLNLDVDSIKRSIENYGYVDDVDTGADYSDFIEGSMRKEGGFYTWYKDFGTPLHYLVSLETDNEEKESKKYEMIDLIGPCCIEKQDVNGNTSLHIVAMRNDLEMMEHILTSEDYFTINTKDLEIKNNEGMTPLDLASPEMKKTIYIALGQYNEDDDFDY